MTDNRFVIYLHGFNSSPQSEKANQTQTYFDRQGQVDLIVPKLPPEPVAAIEMVKDLVAERGVKHLAGFIGSSLGGFYSLHLQNYFQGCKEADESGISTDNCPVVLINPAIRPYDLLVDYLGENRNLYTGERYMVEPHHMDQLRSLDVDVTANRQAHYLLLQTGDEVLNYREAIVKLAGAKLYVVGGGDHSFQDYSATLHSIHRFLSQTNPVHLSGL